MLGMLLRYFGGLRASQRVLWCYLLWYLFVAIRYFEADPKLWLSSLGISAIIGTALYLSTARAGRTRVRLDRWQIARLYVMPFCVSSFAALIKGRGFILIFHPSAHADAARRLSRAAGWKTRMKPRPLISAAKLETQNGIR